VTPRVNGASDQTVEPLANYAVLRAQQDLKDGDVGFSAIATAVSRSLDKWTDPYMNEGAYTGGATYRNRFAHKNYEFSAQVAGSHVTGTPTAIWYAQTNSTHYYQ